MAFYDALTQLPNRTSFYNYLSRTLKRNKITREPFALFFIDLDEFKSINDTLGHDFGDMLLIEAASRLQSSIRVDDFLARISGDEFTIIMKNVDGEKHLASIARNIIHSISQPYMFHKTQAFISCSIGIAIFPDDGENANTLRNSPTWPCTMPRRTAKMRLISTIRNCMNVKPRNLFWLMS